VALIRTALIAAFIYAAYLVVFPDWRGGTLYHVLVPAFIAGGVVGLSLLKKALDIAEGAMKIGLEIFFLLGVALFLGFTLPQRSGMSPLSQWSHGKRPTRYDALRGLERLHGDPHGLFGEAIRAVFSP
jgi:hypothetical protein